MTITLPPELQDFVNRKVESGSYSSAEDVVRDALNVLRDQDRDCQITIDQLRSELAIGIAQADAGQLAPMDMDEIMAEVRKRLTSPPAQGA